MNAIASAPTHWCKVGTTFIFLDLTRDRYFTLERGAADRFSRIVRGCKEAIDRDWLAARGLNNLAPPVEQTWPRATAPTCSLLEEPSLDRASTVDTARAVWALLIARRQVRNSPLTRIFANFPRAVPEPPRVQYSQARATVAAFQRARHYVSGIDECLSCGVAMRRMLAGKGCEARLVIGVTLPFAAHCWVQLGSTVLTDPLDVVMPYTPILIV